MKPKIYLPKTIDELRKIPYLKQSDLWKRYVDKIYQKQGRSLWYYIACENTHLRVEAKHIIKLNKYAQNPEECLLKVHKNKYHLTSGSQITKTFRGIEFRVMIVNQNDFIYKDKHYKTLSAVAKKICGIKVSGPDFFGLNNKKAKELKNV